MSERFEKLFSLPENLYAEGSPVLISAGNLLKDAQTGKVLAQLKLKNLSAKTVKAARLILSALDTMGQPLDSETEKEYLDLSVKQGEEFGQKTAIPLPDLSTRGYTVQVTRVIFADNSTWDGTSEAWEPLPVAENLSLKLGDAELAKQYRLKYGGKCDVSPQEHKDLWRCACGTWNSGAKCYCCGNEKNALLNLDLAALIAEKDARLTREKEEREAKEAEDKAAREAKEAEAAVRAKKAKKTLAIVLPVLVVIVAALLIVTQVIIPNGNYNAAKALLDAGQFDDAIAAFEALDGYKDSAEQINIAREAKTEAENAEVYAEAEALLEKGDYDGAIAAFEALGDYRDSRARLAEAKEAFNAAAYTQAESLLSAKDYRGAYDAFLALGSYRDSEDRADTIKKEHSVYFAAVGDYVTFGAYEQDNNTSNGKESIEWLVLAKDGNRILVISRYALDCKPYNTEAGGTRWEWCTLRKWLNVAFLMEAFSREEQEMIATVTLNEDNEKSGSTQDKIFLLSAKEARQYFSKNSERTCEPTAYAIAQGCFENTGRCFWWLRSPCKLGKASVVEYPGGVYTSDRPVECDAYGVRPVIWIDLGTR